NCVIEGKLSNRSGLSNLEPPAHATRAHLPLPPKSVGKRSAAVCGAPAAAIGASGTLRSFHHGLAFGGGAAGPSDTAALRGRCRDAPKRHHRVFLAAGFAVSRGDYG